MPIWLTILFDIIMAWWKNRQQASNQQKAQAALIRVQSEEKDHAISEKIREEQSHLSAADVDELLRPPSDRNANNK